MVRHTARGVTGVEGPPAVGVPLSYALVTPARDEAEHLPRLARSVAAQTVPPDVWVIVDDESADGTRAVAQRLGARCRRIAMRLLREIIERRRHRQLPTLPIH